MFNPLAVGEASTDTKTDADIDSDANTDDARRTKYDCIRLFG